FGPGGGGRAGRVQLDVEPLVGVLRDAAVGEGVLRFVRDDVRPAEAESFAGAEDGGGVVRVEEAVEDDGHAGEAGGDDGEDARPAVVGEEVPVETPVA